MIIAIPVLAPDGKVAGIIAGSLALQSTSRLSELSRLNRENSSHSRVMDRTGILLAHPKPQGVLGRAADEPGLAELFARWHGSGSPVDSEGYAAKQKGRHCVAVHAEHTLPDSIGIE